MQSNLEARGDISHDLENRLCEALTQVHSILIPPQVAYNLLGARSRVRFLGEGEYWKNIVRLSVLRIQRFYWPKKTQ